MCRHALEGVKTSSSYHILLKLEGRGAARYNKPMIIINGKQYPSHKEYFDKFPWMLRKNRKFNLPLLMAEYTKPCTDCRLRWHPAVMTLDHIARDGYHNSKGKRIHPSDMVEYPPETFQAELAKCEPVCRNCHTMREMVRDGHLKRKEYLELGTNALLSHLPKTIGTPEAAVTASTITQAPTPSSAPSKSGSRPSRRLRRRGPRDTTTA